MAIRIFDLAHGATLDILDRLPFVDVSDHGQSADGSTKHLTLGDLDDRYTDLATSLAGGSITLGLAEITSDVTVSATSLTDVAGLSVNVTVGSRPVAIEFFSPALSADANAGIVVHVIRGTTDLGNVAGGLIGGGSWAIQGHGVINDSPAAGTYTYKIRAKRIGGTTALISAGTGGAANNAAAFIKVVEQ